MAPAMTGDKLAAGHPMRFLSLGEHADVDIMTYRQAKAEYSRLD
jgi:hypothetical protein